MRKDGRGAAGAKCRGGSEVQRRQAIPPAAGPLNDRWRGRRFRPRSRYSAANSNSSAFSGSTAFDAIIRTGSGAVVSDEIQRSVSRSATAPSQRPIQFRSASPSRAQQEARAEGTATACRPEQTARAIFLISGAAAEPKRSGEKRDSISPLAFSTATALSRSGKPEQFRAIPVMLAVGDSTPAGRQSPRKGPTALGLSRIRQCPKGGKPACIARIRGARSSTSR